MQKGNVSVMRHRSHNVWSHKYTTQVVHETQSETHLSFRIPRNYTADAGFPEPNTFFAYSRDYQISHKVQ